MRGKNNQEITRRKFIKTAGAGGLALGAAALPLLPSKAMAAKTRDHILIGHPSSLTGPLAGLGEPTQWVTDRVLKLINDQGGIFVKEAGKKLPVKVKIVDTASDPTKAGEVASRLIMKDKIDIMLVMYTPDIVNPVSAVCERFKMPCVALGTPVEPWLTGGPYKWTYQSFWTVDRMVDIYIDIWDKVADRTDKIVGGLFPNDTDGSVMAPLFDKKMSARGYKFVDPGRFPYFMKDFSPTINTFKSNKVDILTASVIAPDLATAWRQCFQQDFIPKVATIGKALLFPSALEALGQDIGHGLTCEVWWSRYHPFKSSLNGESAGQLCDDWEKDTGRQWAPPVGFKYGGYELVFDVLKRAQSLDREALAEANGKTDLKTIIGRIKYNEKHYCETPLVGGQWVKGKKWPFELQLIETTREPEIPVTAEMVFPLKKS